MKTEVRVAILSLVVVAFGVGAYFASPALRTRVTRETRSLLGWTEAARQADPVGFTAHVEQRLTEDLGKLNSTRRELAIEVGSLVKKEKEQRNMMEMANQFAEEFRAVYQDASQDGTFPVSIRNADYTEEEVVSQVSLLLAEAGGYRQSLVKLNEVRQKAEERLEELTVRINSTDAQLASIAAQRGLLRARVLTDEGEHLVAQVDELLSGNSVVIHGNPVRNVRELLAASHQETQGTPSAELARRFLATKPTIEAETSPKVEVSVTKPKRPQLSLKPEVEVEEAEPKIELAVKPNEEAAPIFQQN